jgi:uncharacterized protein (DUF2141 family)
MTILLLTLASFVMSPIPPKKIQLTVEVQAIGEQKGAIQVALYDSPGGFPGKSKPAQGKSVVVRGASAQVVFEVEPGDYAIAVFHDKNSNGKLDTGAFGIPKEPYGFSNNIRPRFSAPSFADCKVVVSSDKSISISVK